jgi:hypothetical protein
MSALYVIGGAISLVMWVGLIHVMVVEPLRGHIYRTRGYISLPPRRVILNRRRTGHRAFGYHSRHLARGH